MVPPQALHHSQKNRHWLHHVAMEQTNGQTSHLPTTIRQSQCARDHDRAAARPRVWYARVRRALCGPAHAGDGKCARRLTSGLASNVCVTAARSRNSPQVRPRSTHSGARSRAIPGTDWLPCDEELDQRLGWRWSAHPVSNLAGSSVATLVLPPLNNLHVSASIQVVDLFHDHSTARWFAGAHKIN